MKKIMVIGAVNSGKTTLINTLNNVQNEAKKTQTLEYSSASIDTPGEYIENPRFYRALMATALDVEYILFIQDAAVEISVFPPGLGQTFPGYSIGVITRTDHEKANVLKAEELLGFVGLKGPVVRVSSFTGEGISYLKKVISWEDDL